MVLKGAPTGCQAQSEVCSVLGKQVAPPAAGRTGMDSDLRGTEAREHPEASTRLHALTTAPCPLRRCGTKKSKAVPVPRD